MDNKKKWMGLAAAGAAIAAFTARIFKRSSREAKPEETDTSPEITEEADKSPQISNG